MLMPSHSTWNGVRKNSNNYLAEVVTDDFDNVFEVIGYLAKMLQSKKMAEKNRRC